MAQKNSWFKQVSSRDHGSTNELKRMRTRRKQTSSLSGKWMFKPSLEAGSQERDTKALRERRVERIEREKKRGSRNEWKEFLPFKSTDSLRSKIVSWLHNFPLSLSFSLSPSLLFDLPSSLPSLARTKYFPQWEGFRYIVYVGLECREKCREKCTRNSWRKGGRQIQKGQTDCDTCPLSFFPFLYFLSLFPLFISLFCPLSPPGLFFQLHNFG